MNPEEYYDNEYYLTYSGQNGKWENRIISRDAEYFSGVFIGHKKERLRMHEEIAHLGKQNVYLRDALNEANSSLTSTKVSLQEACNTITELTETRRQLLKELEETRIKYQKEIEVMERSVLKGGQGLW